jgi:hypothetical protein
MKKTVKYRLKETKKNILSHWPRKNLTSKSDREKQMIFVALDSYKYWEVIGSLVCFIFYSCYLSRLVGPQIGGKFWE